MSDSNNAGLRKKARQQAFLAAFRQSGNIRLAGEASDVGRSTHYEWMGDDPEYAALFKEAQAEAAELLEEEARRRAVEGVSEPVGWYQGRPGGHVTKYSDNLLMFLLKGAKPEKYRERVEHSGNGEQPLTFRIVRE